MNARNETSESAQPAQPAPATPAGLMPAYRVLDAAANRAREGLRVIEDYTRFVLDDAHLTAGLKELRHGLTAALAGIARVDRLAARETGADVGTRLTVPSEQRRGDLGAIAAANFGRLQEALRTLEEFGKLVKGVDFRAIEQLRYRTYTLERALAITARSCERLAPARLYVLIDACRGEGEFLGLVKELVGAGVDVLQLRDKALDDRQLLGRARLLREATRGTNTQMIVNDRPDLAVLCDADGVHVGQEELTVKDARTMVGPGRLVGVSTHSMEQARQAVLDGADYLGVGPIFASATKDFANYPGLDFARAVAAEIRLPAFAIGGIGPRNVSAVLETGIGRIAVASAVTAAGEPAGVVRELLDQLKRGPGEGESESAL